MKKVNIFLVIITVILVSCKDTFSQVIDTNSPFSFKVETVVSDLEIPWGLAFLPDGSILISEQTGELIHFKNGKKTEVQNIPKIYNKNQGGLLDIELHPNYAKNGWIYFSMSANLEKDGKGGSTVIMRAKLVDNKLVKQEILYKSGPNVKAGYHFGSRLEFDNDGYLYFSIGDRGKRDINPQDITKDNGKIYRIYDNGKIPTDNPFYNNEGAKKAIYSYGHRNPQGMALHPVTGKIWTHEHGPKGGDEINIINAGKNYGWPKITYGINYDGTTITDNTSLPGMEQPLHYWVPSIAPSGMTFVTSDKYPNWKDNLLVGSLKFQYLNRCVLKNGKVVKEEKLLEGMGRVRTVHQAPDGYIYVAIEQLGIVKIVPE
ncbi:MAG: PQQ-dependent sugar dehydrogenase [Flavobacteriaceae bacterium]|nr:PQQ-dependent sugar dehydrogenase [Flavobacteriaceae bacterium]